jgi:hypothetical protein
LAAEKREQEQKEQAEADVSERDFKNCAQKCKKRIPS